MRFFSMKSMKRLIVIAFLLVACGSQGKTAQTQGTSESTQSPAKPKVLATVNGVAITESDVASQHKGELAQADRDYQQKHYQIMENGMNLLINDRVLATEASAQGISKDQLMANSIRSAPVTDADVDKFYEENKGRINGTKEQVAGQIKSYLQQQNDARARQAYFDVLRSKYKVEVLLDPIRVDVAAAGPVKGVAEAPVTIVEFSDFQCPFCSRLVPVMDQITQKYGNQVRLVFRQFPLNIHAQAQKAAEAALCANEQGKFWEMHDAMFHDQQGLAVDGLKAKAVSLGLNADQFNQCLDSGKMASAVRADIEAGEAVGVNSTPAMFINGRLVLGAVPIEQITPVIDDEIRRKSSPQKESK